MKNIFFNNLLILRMACGAAVLTASAGLTGCAAPSDEELAEASGVEEDELADEEDEGDAEELALVQARGPSIVGVTRSDASRSSGGGTVTRTVRDQRSSNAGRTVRIGGSSSGGRTVRIGGGSSSGRTVRVGGGSSGGRTVRIGGARRR